MELKLMFYYIDGLLPYFYPYGEIDICKITFSIVEEGSKIYTYTLDEKSRLILNSWLVGEGFAVKRYDIDKDGGIIQLTDMGRDLKNCGSISKYSDFERAKKEEVLQLQNDRKRETRRNELQYWVNVSIAISTGAAACYYLLEIHSHHKNAFSLLTYYATCVPLVVVFAILLWLLLKLQRNRQSKRWFP